MLEIAEKLSKNSPEVRVDLYNVNGKIYFGELTFYDNSGFDINVTYESDLDRGQKLKLPTKKKR